MNRRSLLVVLASVFFLCLSSGAVATAAPNPLGSLDLGSLGGPATHGCSVASYEQKSELGPQTLSNEPPTGPQLAGYQRFGSLPGSTEFLAKYWDTEKKWWKYPDGQGYVLDRNHQPIKHKATMKVGRRLDRYGGERGNFLAPAGTKYAARSLPPSNLSGPQGQEEYCNYHVYEVIKDLPVDTGRIAPWFEQRGGGIQYEVVRSYLTTEVTKNPQCDSFINDDDTLGVAWLRCAGYVQQVFPAVH